MNDQEPQPDADPSDTRGPLLYIGAIGLLAAMLVDACAVIGRHIGLHLLGSIELVQAAILVASSASIVAATLARKHAVVHLLTNRASPAMRALLERVSALLGAVFFLLLVAGSAWIASDLWHGHEQSEVLRIPYAPLRLIGLAALLSAAGIQLVQAVRRRRA
jgi:TRAP-type transport system small permease protein